MVFSAVSMISSSEADRAGSVIVVADAVVRSDTVRSSAASLAVALTPDSMSL